MRSSALILLVAGWTAGDNLVAQGDADEVAERSRPPGVTVLLDEASPTDRALARAILDVLPPERVRRILRGPKNWAPPVLRELDGPGATVVLAVGAAPAAAALEVTHRVPLLLCGRLDERVILPIPGGSGGRRVVAVPLPGMETELPAALERYLPEVRRLGLITSRARWPVGDAVGGEVSIVGIHPAAREVPALIAGLAPRADALLILDEAGSLGSGEDLMRAAQSAGMPVITDAPWLARSGAALAILPRLDLWAVRIAAQLREIGTSRASRPGAALPPRVEIDVGTLDRMGMLPAPDRLAAAQVLRGTIAERTR